MKKLLSYSLSLFCIFFSLELGAQNEAQKWYFGSQAGLDFSTNPPTILTNGAMNTGEGCASISDGAGNLLFYTDGLTVYNKTHVVMANGTGLMGNGSTTQSGIIVKQPGSLNIYYIFTQDDVAGPDGLRYSEVDMSLAAGMGSVTVKNFALFTPSCEKITAVKHCNGKDAWVVSHDWNSNNFRTYLVTAAGVSLTPVISSVGAITTATGLAVTTLGQMKISPNGKKLGLAIYDYNAPAAFEIYDFDPATGIVSNPLVLGNFMNNYGCEFSPDGSKFYGGCHSTANFFQWDLCAGSSTAIIASQYTITTTGGNSSFQLAPNGKIYIAVSGSTLGVIDNPNASGAACNFIANGQSVAPNMCTLGLPNFINSFFQPAPLPFTHTVNCSNVSFNSPAISNTLNAGCGAIATTATNVLWNFGEPTSGAANSSTLTNPSHTYSVAGNYTVQLIQYRDCTSDTLRTTINVLNPSPLLNVTGNFTMCAKEKRTFTVSGATSYTWTGGAHTTTISIQPTVTATYSVAGSGTNSCSSSKLFTVTVNKCTAIAEGEASLNTLKIFPNPTSNQLMLETENFITLKLINQFGKVIFEGDFEAGKHTLDMSRFSDGIYTLQYTGKNTTRSIRVVKLE